MGVRAGMIMHQTLGRAIRSLIDGAPLIVVVRRKRISAHVVRMRIFRRVQRRMAGKMRAPSDARHHQRTRDQDGEDIAGHAEMIRARRTAAQLPKPRQPDLSAFFGLREYAAKRDRHVKNAHPSYTIKYVQSGRTSHDGSQCVPVGEILP